jgi:DGQHR domain-containing protein
MSVSTDSMDDFDPTEGATLQQQLKYCSIGKAPTGFPKIHVEMSPADLIRMIGYDPRTIQAVPRRGQQDPHHLSQDIIDLIREVQRSIDPRKVEEMVKYLHEAVSSDKYADWAELDVVTAVKPDQSKYRETGAVYFPASTEYFITDGQHRYCALMDFARRYPDLAKKFTQAVAISILPQDRLDEWAGQSFHDKNYLRTQVKMTKALAVDNRDLHNVLAKELHGHSVIKNGGGINEVKDALAATAKEFATHAVLYRFTRAFCEGRRGIEKGAVKNPKLTAETFDTFKTELFDYIDELYSVLPNWISVPGREHYLFRSSPALQALGVLGHELYTKVEETPIRSQMIARIGEGQLDWKRSNVAEWESVIGIAVEDEKGTKTISPRASRQAVDGTIRFLRDKSGLGTYLETEDAADAPADEE